jgi:hypothetical protein
VGAASLTGGSEQGARPVVRFASVCEERANTASEYLGGAFDVMTEAGFVGEESARATLTDDFVYEDRRSSMPFPDADAASFPAFAASIWQTGAGGRPRFEHETLAVRGERFAALAVRIDYGNGMLFESIHAIALDPTLNLLQRSFDFDRDDLDGAIAELDRLHRHAEAG